MDHRDGKEVALRPETDYQSCLRDLLYAPTWTPFYGFPELWRDRWDGSAASEAEKGENVFILFFRLFGRRRRALRPPALFGLGGVGRRLIALYDDPPRELDALFIRPLVSADLPQGR